MSEQRRTGRPEEAISVDPDSLAQVQKLSELGLMTAAVLHELKQPVAGIKGYAQLLREGCPAPEEKVAALLNQVRRLEELIENHRRFLSPWMQPGERADLCEVARQALRLSEAKARRAGVAVACALPEEAVEVEANAGQLLQIAANLVDNAIDAQAGRGAQVPPVQMVVRAGPAPELLVADSGTGLAPGAERQLFTAFHTSKGPEAGTGLGLFVSRRLASANGGALEYVRPRDAGLRAVTVFRLRFGGAGPAPAPVRPRVLVVDDEEVVRSLLASLLEPEGLEVVCAESGAEGLRHVREGHFDLVITDKNLPGATGLEITRVVRERNPECPVMLITGYASLETAQEALSLGAVDYLEKPFDDIAEVRRRVREVLDARPPALEPAAQGAAHTVLVVCGSAATGARLGEAVALAGGDPVVVHSSAEAIAVVGPETAGVILALDMPGERMTPELARALRGSAAVPLVLVCDALSLKDTVAAIHLGAAACLSTRAPRQDLARELAKVFGARLQASGSGPQG